MDNELKGRDSREVQGENEIECIPPDGMELTMIQRAHVLYCASACLKIKKGIAYPLRMDRPILISFVFLNVIPVNNDVATLDSITCVYQTFSHVIFNLALANDGIPQYVNGLLRGKTQGSEGNRELALITKGFQKTICSDQYGSKRKLSLLTYTDSNPCQMAYH